MIRDVEVRDAGSKGKGVFALRDFKRGEFIFRRRHARVVHERELASLRPTRSCTSASSTGPATPYSSRPAPTSTRPADPNAMRSGVRSSLARHSGGDEIVIDYRLNATGGERWSCGTAEPRAASARRSRRLLRDGRDAPTPVFTVRPPSSVRSIGVESRLGT